MDQSSPASYHSEIDSRRSFGKNMPFAYEEARSETPLSPSSGDFSFIGSDRRFAFARQPSLARSSTDSRSSPSPLYTRSPLGAASPTLPRTGSGIDIPPGFYSGNGYDWLQTDSGMFEKEKTSTKGLGFWVFGNLRGGTRPMRRLLLMILLNVLYSTTELLIGLLSGRVGLVSDAFHLTFGCGLLTFSLFAMAMSRKKPDRVYTYGYKRLEVLAAFTNALFLLFMSFSLAVEALHAFVQDESEHKHYLVVSAVTNLLVNLIGVWFFRGYARLNLVYRNAEDMNNHSVCLHVLADSIRRFNILSIFPLYMLKRSGLISMLICQVLSTFYFSVAAFCLTYLDIIIAPNTSAGLIMASWLLTIGVENAEVLCMGLVSVTVFVLVRPIFMATGGILLQTAPSSIPSSAMSKCYRQITSREDVSEIYEGRFWELVPGHAVGSISIQVKDEVDDRPILHYTHGLYQDIGVQNLTVQTEYSADAE